MNDSLRNVKCNYPQLNNEQRTSTSLFLFIVIFIIFTLERSVIGNNAKL